MGDRLTFRNGHWADIREPVDVPERKRRPVIDAAAGAAAHYSALQSIADAVASGNYEKVEVPDPSAMTNLQEVVDACIVAFVSRWSFGGPEEFEGEERPAGEPVTMDVLLDDVPGDAYAAIRDHVLPMFKDIMPDFSADAMMASGQRDPRSPMQPSAV